MLKAFRRKKEETELEKYVKRLKANDPRLTTLDLSFDLIGVDGAKAIAEALKVNPNTVLTIFSFDGNSIGDNLLNDIKKSLMQTRTANQQ